MDELVWDLTTSPYSLALSRCLTSGCVLLRDHRADVGGDLHAVHGRRRGQDAGRRQPSVARRRRQGVGQFGSGAASGIRPRGARAPSATSASPSRSTTSGPPMARASISTAAGESSALDPDRMGAALRGFALRRDFARLDRPRRHHGGLRPRVDPRGGRSPQRSPDRLRRLRLAAARHRRAGGGRVGGRNLLDVPVHRPQPDQAAQPSRLARSRCAHQRQQQELDSCKPR